LEALQFELECLEAHQAESSVAATSAPSKDGKVPGNASVGSDLSAAGSASSASKSTAGSPGTNPPVKVPTHSRGAKIQANVLRELVAGASAAAAKDLASAAALSVSARDE
jgi:hypothetical protein